MVITGCCFLHNMSKTKQLLDGLNKIVEKPKQPQQIYHSYSNRFYDEQKTLHKLPAIYDKARRHKDDEGDEYIMIDRVYGSIFKGGSRLQQADGTIYEGKLYSKRRLVTHKDPMSRESKSFYSACTVTADGRWFDNGGMPIEVPAKLEPEKVKTAEEIEEEKQKQAEIAKRKEEEILANLK